MIAKPVFSTGDSSVVAKFNLEFTRYNCHYIFTLYDSSYVTNSFTDSIVKWTINWGDNSNKAIQQFSNKFAKNTKHTYTRNGNLTIHLKVETALGKQAEDSISIYIPGPVINIDTFIKRQYCVGELVTLKGFGTYSNADSNIWIWDFGDRTGDTRFFLDTISHIYHTAGTYNIQLQTFYHYLNAFDPCSIVSPDTNGRQERPLTIRIINCGTSIQNAIAEESIGIYPNPANQQLNITSNYPTDVLIIDRLGSIVKSFIIEGNQTINLEGISPGLYLVSNGQRKIISKLVIE